MRSQGGGKGIMPPKFLENIVILCFERRFSKQNSVIRLELKILPPQISGLATPLISRGKCPFPPLRTPMFRSDGDIFLKNFGKMRKF